uniref:Transmembrane protein n=1 Tax=Rhizophora mucronata TaxID=61149 RepID=A0A2P2P2J9_RHIMU
MSDRGPVFVAVVLFVLLTPGLLFQVPGRHRCVEFGYFQTSGASILIHSLLYSALICIFLLAIRLHVYLG